ncbi:hypothetical protein LP420_21505 [Massilia sp. B-10]|nr:hypothetical protein LP420_21505 [Massilia sp. B-10]
MGQARQPFEALDLIVAQLGLQGAWQLRREGGAVGHPGQVRAPGLVGVDAARFTGQFFEREAGQRMHAHTVAMLGAERGQFHQAPVQLGRQRQELVVAQRHETAAARLERFEQRAQIQHAVLVDLQFGLRLEPVLVALDRQAHRFGVRLFGDAERFAFRPRHDDLVRIEFLQFAEQLQAGDGLAEQPFAVVRFRLFQRLATGDQLALGLALGIEVAPRFDPRAYHVGDHASWPEPGA